MKFDVSSRTVPENAVWCPVFDEDAQSHGSIFYHGDNIPDGVAAVLVISTESFAYRRAMQRKLQEARFLPISRADRRKVSSEKETALWDMLELEMLRDVVLCGWANFEAENQPYLFSKENADLLLTSNAWFRGQVQRIAGGIGEAETVQREEAEKNY